MVADFGIVDTAGCDLAFFCADLTGDVGIAIGGEGGEALREGGDDVFCEIAGIGAGIGKQFVFFVKTLQEGEGLFGAEAVASVGVALQGGEVVEGRWRGVLFLGVKGGDDGVLFVATADDALANALIAEARSLIFALILPEQAHAVDAGLHFIVRCALKVADGAFALHDHCQGWCLHAASRELSVVAAGEGAGDVEADDPVGFAARDGRTVEVVVFAGRFEVGEALADGLVGLAGDPESAHRFFDVGLLNDPTGDEFTFAASVGGDDDFIDIAAFHQARDGAELFAGLRNDNEIHVFGQDRQGVHAPGFVFIAVVFRIGQGDEVAEGPGDNVFIVFKITVVPCASAQHAGKLAANGGFFCEYEGFSHDVSFFLSGFLQYSTVVRCRV